jgi:hypothetical protein
LEEQQLHSSHVTKAEEFDFEYVGSKKKEKFQRLNAFLSRSKHLNFVDTLTLAAILDFLIHYYYNLLHPLYLGVESHVTSRAFSRLPNDKKGKALGTRLSEGCILTVLSGIVSSIIVSIAEVKTFTFSSISSAAYTSDQSSSITLSS